MYTTWLGEYVALEVGPMHYVAMGVSIAIAILTTAEIIWQNVAERKPELAVLKAVGWQNRSIRILVLIEGALSGLIAGILGLIIAFAVVGIMYNQFPIEQLPFFLLTILIPILTGVIGAVLPAKKAGEIQPYQGLTGGLINTKKTEKSFQYVFSAIGIALFIGTIALLTQVIPDAQETNTNIENNTSNAAGTTGEVKEIYTTEEKNQSKPVAGESKEERNSHEQNESNFIKDKVDSANEKFPLGKRVMDGAIAFEFNVLPKPAKDIKGEMNNSDLITITVLAENEDIGFIYYQPHVTYALYDKAGNKYEPLGYKVLEQKDWKGNLKLASQGKLKMRLTYEVPKSTKKLILFGHHTWTAKSGTFVVGIRK